jgi:hypothetical protein
MKGGKGEGHIYVVNEKELRLGFSNTTRNPEGIHKKWVNSRLLKVTTGPAFPRGGQAKRGGVSSDYYQSDTPKKTVL